MFLQGMEWIILVGIIVILLFGARKIPELARSIGKSLGEFEKGKAEAEAEVQRLKQRKPTEHGEEETPQKVAKELGIETEGKTKEKLAKLMLK